MLTRRIIINLIAFFAVSGLLIAYGIEQLLENPFAARTSLSTDFPDASGLYQHFTVELNGVDVGQVANVTLAPHGARIDMSINPGIKIPADVNSRIDIANDLGEQVVELTPSSDGRTGFLHDGDVVPTASNSLPANVGEVVAAATRLLNAIPAGQLDKLIVETATALAGQGANLRTIITASTQFSKEFLAYQNQFKALLANAPPVLDAVSAAGGDLHQALANTQTLLGVLAQKRGDLTTLLNSGSVLAGQLNDLLNADAPNLACLFVDLSNVTANLAAPTQLSELSNGLAWNTYFFGGVNEVVVSGPTKATTTNQQPGNVLWLRTRLFLPPKMPAAVSYAQQNQLPPVEPGAGCVTSLGRGVGPATQPGFTPAGPEALLIPPTAAQANVLGTDGDH